MEHIKEEFLAAKLHDIYPIDKNVCSWNRYDMRAVKFVIVPEIDKLKASRDDLLVLIKKAHKEGYVDGYSDGVATDGCVENNIIDQDDWVESWNTSECQQAIAKANQT